MSNKQILLFIISSAYCRFDQTSYGAGVSKKLKKKKKNLLTVKGKVVLTFESYGMLL